jgi:hypothetical protein
MQPRSTGRISGTLFTLDGYLRGRANVGQITSNIDLDWCQDWTIKFDDHSVVKDRVTSINNDGAA